MPLPHLVQVAAKTTIVARGGKYMFPVSPLYNKKSVARLALAARLAAAPNRASDGGGYDVALPLAGLWPLPVHRLIKTVACGPTQPQRWVFGSIPYEFFG